jgi:hypothetical protein
MTTSGYATAYTILAKLQPLLAIVAQVHKYEIEEFITEIALWAKYTDVQGLDRDLKELLRG